MKSLVVLKRDYNEILVRYNAMCKWAETASEEEQLKNYKHAIEVIKTYNELINEIKKQDRFVTANEIIYGFK